MERKINVNLLHACLVAAFAGLLVLVLAIDLPAYLATNDVSDLRWWYPSIIHPNKIVAIVFASLAGCAFLVVMVWYAPIRRSKAAPYLSSLVFSSATFQCISRFIEIYYWVSECDLKGIVFITGKFYFALDVVASVLLVIVAFNIFILPGMDEQVETRATTFHVIIASSSPLVACITLFFFYLPITTFTYVVMALALAIFAAVMLTVASTATRIFKLWVKTEDPVSRSALRALAIQLILSVVVLLFLILSEVGVPIGIDYTTQYVLRWMKNAMYLAIALLYLPSLIWPSRRKAMASEHR